MSEKDELTLKEALVIASNLTSHFEGCTNRNELVEQLFELATAIQSKYAGMTPKHPSHKILPSKSPRTTSN